MADSSLVLPGDVVSSDASFLLQGHGTYVSGNLLRASYLGRVKHVNQLAYVEPFGGKYVGQIGDIVIGVVESIQGNKWFIDVNAVERAQLSILQVNTEELANRRKLDEDVYEMSNLFSVRDIVSCEIQRISVGRVYVQPSGTIMLQTRTSKYGRLDNGTLVVVRPTLVVRQSRHVFDMECGVRVVLGCNGTALSRSGYVWLTPAALDLASAPPEHRGARVAAIRNICVVRALLLMLSAHLVKINFDVIVRAFRLHSRLFPGRCELDSAMARAILSALAP